MKTTPSASIIDSAVTLAGGFAPGIRDELITSSGLDADSLAGNPQRLREAIGRHRQQFPERFLPERAMQRLARVPEKRRASETTKAVLSYVASHRRNSVRKLTPLGR